MRIQQKDSKKEYRDDNKKRHGFTIGTSLVLVTFVILALVTFAAISYVQAQSDLKLADKAIGNTENYYAANSKAGTIRAAVNDRLRACQENVTFEEDYYAALDDALSDLGVTVRHSADGAEIEYSVCIDDRRNLLVVLKAETIGAKQLTSVRKWEIISSQSEELEEQTLQLIF